MIFYEFHDIHDILGSHDTPDTYDTQRHPTDPTIPHDPLPLPQGSKQAPERRSLFSPGTSAAQGPHKQAGAHARTHPPGRVGPHSRDARHGTPHRGRHRKTGVRA